ILNSLTATSIIGNTLLLLLLYHPRSVFLGNYRYLLFTFALTDIVISLYHAWYIPILLGSYGYAFFGYSTLTMGGVVASQATMIYTITFYAPFYVLCVHFIYRRLSEKSMPTRFLPFLESYGITALNAPYLNYAAISHYVRFSLTMLKKITLFRRTHTLVRTIVHCQFLLLLEFLELDRLRFPFCAFGKLLR
ncbi:hypothetical protein PMAYCL1PPCAC_17055, partial [Pristionchus mayeri]